MIFQIKKKPFIEEEILYDQRDNSLREYFTWRGINFDDECTKKLDHFTIINFFLLSKETSFLVNKTI